MDLSSLTPTKRKEKNRVGRGAGSGNGKTSGRGQKGSGARSGGNMAPWFEGGQMPLYRRLPRRGFNNKRFKKVYQLVNISALKELKDIEEINHIVLQEKGLIEDIKKPVKILGLGEMEFKCRVIADRFTKSAKEKILNAGGEAVLTNELVKQDN